MYISEMWWLSGSNPASPIMILMRCMVYCVPWRQKNIFVIYACTVQYSTSKRMIYYLKASLISLTQAAKACLSEYLSSLHSVYTQE